MCWARLRRRCRKRVEGVPQREGSRLSPQGDVAAVRAEVERVSGMRRIELPSSLAFRTAERLHRIGVIPAPASDLQYVVHPWVVPSTRLRAAGWHPTYDNPTSLGLLLEQARGHHAVAARRVGRRDATIGAAGAAVAVVGTAALVRAARRKRKG